MCTTELLPSLVLQQHPLSLRLLSYFNQTFEEKGFQNCAHCKIKQRKKQVVKLSERSVKADGTGYKIQRGKEPFWTIIYVGKRLLRGEFGTFLPYERIENRKKL